MMRTEIPRSMGSAIGSNDGTWSYREAAHPRNGTAPTNDSSGFTLEAGRG
jgi:hypothetical protein